MRDWLIIEGDALDLMRMHRKSAMGRASGDEPLDAPADPAAPEGDEPLDRPFTGEDDWFAQGDMHFMGDEDEPLDVPAEPGFGGEDEPLGEMPNDVKPQDVPEPDASGGYTEEPVEMPWSGHAVHGNADFGPDQDTEESSIIDPEGGEEFGGGHPDEYDKASEEEGFGGEPEE